MPFINGCSREDFETWCETNGYEDWDDWLDVEEESYKRYVISRFYLKHSKSGKYAYFHCTVDYDWGADNFCIYGEEFIRTEVEVMTKQIKYIKE